MSNMSYCRFENTLADLADCLEALQNNPEGDDLNDTELQSRARLLEMSAEIAEGWYY